MPMKRLFEVVGPKGPFGKEREFFPNKGDAKDYRDDQRVKSGTIEYYVILGPDHWKYGLSAPARTHSHSRAKAKVKGFIK